MNCEQLAKIINIQDAEAAFSILFASVESDDGTWMPLLYEIQGLVDDAAIAKLLRMLWIDNSDNVDREVAIKMFIKYGKQSMDSKELAIVDEWEDTITVYRGGFGTGTDISWSIDKDVAISFNGGNPLVEERKVTKTQILAFYDCGEKEVIIY